MSLNSNKGNDSNTDCENMIGEEDVNEEGIRCRINFTRGQNPIMPTTVNPKTNLHKGELFILNLSEQGNQKILLEVDEERSNQSPHPEILIDESIRRTFSISIFINNYYLVQKVKDKQKFSLYLVEVLVKEQYLSRGDMWRFTRKLMNTAVYLKKPLDIFGMRATVYGLWVDGTPYRVSSGYITNKTKIVFRSSSVFCTIFLQMSKEMWEFDHYGDTYYEKAIDGFFFDLFTRWKNMNCQHDVTMTLFSRVFYEAKSIEDFPVSLRPFINQDHRNRFYEDFYRVIYQNERYDDWLPRLARIKEACVNYQDEITNYHRTRLPKKEASKMPKAFVSCAADGNFLETLNLSSSVFERHFIDRAFDRLGQMSLIITPGAGVFEVDRELTNMTKQRVLDNGIGSDLVCLGEQPLFAVPLFKFFKKDPQTADDYQIPHWMNLSYYHSATAPSCFKRYIPRLPFDTSRISNEILDANIAMSSIGETTFAKPPHIYMDEYDSKIFMTGRAGQNDRSNREINQRQRLARKRYITAAPIHQSVIEEEDPVEEPKGIWIVKDKNFQLQHNQDEPRPFNKNIKDDLFLSTSHATSASIAANQQYDMVSDYLNQILNYSSTNVQRMAKSADTALHSITNSLSKLSRPKALTNPFAPASIRIPMAPGRRRWAHTFPIGPDKLPWHFHHLRQSEAAIKRKMLANTLTYVQLVLPSTSKRVLDGFVSKRSSHQTKNSSDFASKAKRVNFNIVSPSHLELRRTATDRKDSTSDENRLANTNASSNQKRNPQEVTGKISSAKNEKRTIIWGPTGVEPWSASMITSIDWKSLTIPASLPTTFDVVPSEESLRRDYKNNSYEMIHSLPNLSDYERKRKYTQSEKTMQLDPMERRRLIFEELIDLRLSQGFQMIPEIPKHVEKLMLEDIRRTDYQSTKYNRLLSIGRLYHTINLADDDNRNQDSVIIFVKQFKLEHVSQPKSVDYSYRFQCPDSTNYDPASYRLQLENLESFPWNTVDNAVCGHGTGDYQLTDVMKYWRTRLVLMPVSRDYTIKSIESGQTRCDSRQEMSPEDFFLYIEHFIRFMTMLNKLVRPRGVPNEYPHRPLDPITGLKRVDLYKRTGKILAPLKIFKLTDAFSAETETITEFTNLLRDEQQGLSFVKDNVLPEYSFIAIEAIWWSIEHCEEIQNERVGHNLFQNLFERGIIRHCTKSEDRFRFGFFLYYVVTEKTESFHLESDDYAEVELYQTETYIPSMDYLGFAKSEPMRLLPKLIVNQRCNGIPSIPSVNDDNRIGSKQESFSNTAVALKRICNVDADPKCISDRREWATAQYHAFYNPHCLFEIEIRWLTATSCLLGDLITNWSQRTATILGSNPVAFHLVPIPCDPFAEFDPLRSAIYIRMNLSCLENQLSLLSEQDRVSKLNIFQELIVKRYGFILNACLRNADENIYYVHISGGMLIYVLSAIFNAHCPRRPKRVASSHINDGEDSTENYGFHWCWNYCLGKKWRSSQTGEEKYQDIMLADFRAFCMNDKNRLLDFWNEVNQKASEEIMK